MALSSEYNRLTYESFIARFLVLTQFQYLYLALSRTSAALYSSLWSVGQWDQIHRVCVQQSSQKGFEYCAWDVQCTGKIIPTS